MWRAASFIALKSRTGESLLELEVHEGFAIFGLADVQDPIDPAVGSALDADHRVDHPPEPHAPGLELLGD
jgi:hypothetical protein